MKITGPYNGVHNNWQGTLCLWPNGTFTKANTSGGKWSFNGEKLYLKWNDWPEDVLKYDSGNFISSSLSLVPMKNKSKIFGIGLSRTGTKSLAVALSIFGYNTKHWPKSFYEIIEFDALCDITISCRYKFLDSVFPDSKFILTTRDKNKWLESMEKFYRMGQDKKATNAVEMAIKDVISDGDLLFSLEADMLLYGNYAPTYSELEIAYDKYIESVQTYFRGRGNLLVLNITNGEGWDILCPFLQKPIPAIPFPHIK